MCCWISNITKIKLNCASCSFSFQCFKIPRHGDTLQFDSCKKEKFFFHLSMFSYDISCVSIKELKSCKLLREYPGLIEMLQKHIQYFIVKKLCHVAFRSSTNIKRVLCAIVALFFVFLNNKVQTGH